MILQHPTRGKRVLCVFFTFLWISSLFSVQFNNEKCISRYSGNSLMIKKIILLHFTSFFLFILSQHLNIVTQQLYAGGWNVKNNFIRITCYEFQIQLNFSHEKHDEKCQWQQSWQNENLLQHFKLNFYKKNCRKYTFDFCKKNLYQKNISNNVNVT